VQIIETDRYREPNRADLVKFLEACRTEAIDDAHYKLASISLRVRHIDPLAVLESIYESRELHCYIEHPQHGEAVAGAEAELSCTASGPARFDACKRFADEVLEHTVSVGDLHVPRSGPLFFAAFAFADESALDAATGTPAALLFVPSWQVARHGGDCVAVANCRVDPDADVERLADRIWAAHGKFSSFEYEVGSTPEDREPHSTAEAGNGDYRARVAEALRRIQAGRYQKIVLARALDLHFAAPFRPLLTLNRLRNRFPNCHAFSFQVSACTSFIGATPERLVRIEDHLLHTEAIAGSQARGSSASEDARHAADLLASDKDLREHRHVIASIRRRLDGLAIDLRVPEHPELLQLANVQHLRSPIRATPTPHTHILQFVRALHPTPAVGGTPREAALPDIAELEAFPRELYAGTIGWFDHRGEGEFVVAIRSARISGNNVRLYAGAGIVSGSVADRELAETEVKMRAMLDAIRG